MTNVFILLKTKNKKIYRIYCNTRVFLF